MDLLLRTPVPRALLSALAVSSALASSACKTTVERPAAEVPACPDTTDVMQGWDTRAAPRKIFGNTYDVGTCGIAAILVTGTQGHVLIDGATEKAAPLIAANLRALGLEPRDVKVLLNTHEHGDHAGGLAELQRLTGAPLLALPVAAPTLRRGTSDRGDPQFAELEPYPAVADVRVLVDGQTVQVGELTLTPHATPGHAPGGTSWTWRSCERSRCVNLAFVDSLSAVSDDHFRHSEHPEYVAAFQRSLDTVEALPCDLLITPHPLASNLRARLEGQAPLIDPEACKHHARSARQGLERRLQKEAGANAP